MVFYLDSISWRAIGSGCVMRKRSASATKGGKAKKARSKLDCIAIYDERCLQTPKQKGHFLERPSRLMAAIDVLKRMQQEVDFKLISGVKVSDIEQKLLMAHSKAYVCDMRERIKRLGDKAEPLTDAEEEDTRGNKCTWAAATAAVSVVCHTVDLVHQRQARRIFCAVRPPGHHAGSSGKTEEANSNGFCVFNNVVGSTAYIR